MIRSSVVNQTVGVLLTLLFLSACAGDTAPASSSSNAIDISGSAFVALGKANIESTASGVRGSGKLISRDVLTEEDNNYSVSLLLDPGGFVEIVANARAGLKAGAGLIFTRESDNHLGIQVKSTGSSIDITQAYENQFGVIDASQPITASFDLHGHGHLVLWLNDNPEFEQPTRRINGTVWGLILQSASVNYAMRGKPKDKH